MSILAVVASIVLGLAGEAVPSEAPPPVAELTVDASSPSNRVLEWRLRPAPPSRIHGNAAIRYQQAAVAIAGLSAADEERIDELRGLSLADLRAADVSVLESSEVTSALDLLSRGARCDECDWGTSIQAEGIGLMLPELGSLRRAARALALQIRVDLARGDWRSACDGIESGLSLAHDLGEGQTLIQCLVGVAIGSLTLVQIEEFIQTPGAPNLYWPLSALDSPLVNLSRASEMELHLLEAEFPEFERIISGEMSPEAMAQAGRRLLDPQALMDGGEPPHDFKSGLRAAAIATALYPRARAVLEQEGLTAGEIDAMPVAAVAVRGTAIEFARERDTIQAYMSLPYWQARAGLQAASKRLESSSGNAAESTILSILPSLSESAEGQARFERQIAALRVIEALRAHAAAHGRFPSSLAEIAIVPIPVDPMTGGPFSYRLDGASALLSAPVPEGCSERSMIQYRITLRN